MECGGVIHIAYPSRKSEFRIWNLSDLHLLSASCAMGDLLRDRKRIEDDPYSIWIGGGDYADFLGYDDAKRFDPDSVSESLSVRDLGRLGKKSVETVRDFLAPIKHKCLGLLLGNHEKQYQRRHQQEDLHAWLCTELGVQHLGYSALLDLVFERQSGRPGIGTRKPGKSAAQQFRIFIHHGAGYATTPGGKLNRLIQFMNYFEADIYFCGHVHDKVGRRQVTIGANRQCKSLVEKVKIGVISGSYLKTYSQGTSASYGEQRGYLPTTLGAAWVGVQPSVRRVWGQI